MLLMWIQANAVLVFIILFGVFVLGCWKDSPSLLGLSIALSFGLSFFLNAA